MNENTYRKKTGIKFFIAEQNEVHKSKIKSESRIRGSWRN